MAQYLCRLEEISATGKEISIAEGGRPRYVMLFRRGTGVVGWRNICPHQGRSLNWAPDRFLISQEGWVVCAHHGACFDLDSGQCTRGPCRGATLIGVQLVTHGDEVWLADD